VYPVSRDSEAEWLRVVSFPVTMYLHDNTKHTTSIKWRFQAKCLWLLAAVVCIYQYYTRISYQRRYLFHPHHIKCHKFGKLAGSSRPGEHFGLSPPDRSLGVCPPTCRTLGVCSPTWRTFWGLSLDLANTLGSVPRLAGEHLGSVPRPGEHFGVCPSIWRTLWGLSPDLANS